jgi:hypothetical protein
METNQYNEQITNTEHNPGNSTDVSATEESFEYFEQRNTSDLEDVPDNIFDFVGYFNPSSRLLLMRESTRRQGGYSNDSAMLCF